MSGEARESLPHWVVEKKIGEIKQDLQETENIFLTSKKDKIIQWCELLELDKERLKPVSTICAEVIGELREMGMIEGLRTIYDYIDPRFKDKDKAEFGSHSHDAWFELQNRSNNVLLDIPIVNYETASHDDLMGIIQKRDDAERECNRRSKEHKAEKEKAVVVARAKGWPIPIKTSDVTSTPLPYDTRWGDAFEELVGPRLESDPEGKAVIHGGWAEVEQSKVKTIVEIATNILRFPPETIKEDKELAQGFKAWRTLSEWHNEQMRPYADLKFSKNYPDWWETQAVNKDHGKHCAAVTNKTATLTGGLRAMTREQVGDKVVHHAEMAMKFRGMLDMANKAFELMQKKLPSWHRKRVAPAVATRKEMVAPKLSESSFGSDKDR